MRVTHESIRRAGQQSGDRTVLAIAYHRHVGRHHWEEHLFGVAQAKVHRTAHQPIRALTADMVQLHGEGAERGQSDIPVGHFDPKQKVEEGVKSLRMAHGAATRLLRDLSWG